MNLPGFVSLDYPAMHGGVRLYGNAFLPARNQATPVRMSPEKQPEIRFLEDGRLSQKRQREQLDIIQALNKEHLRESEQDARIEGVINSYELAYRMQSVAPEVLDLSLENEATKALYGIGESGDWFQKPSYLGFYTAPQPWGPWTQICEEKEWKPGGDAAARCYQHADTCVPATPLLQRRAFQLWADSMRPHSIDHDEAHQNFADWSVEDFYPPLVTELRLLAEAGFAEPECFMREGAAAVFGAVKQP